MSDVQVHTRKVFGNICTYGRSSHSLIRPKWKTIQYSTAVACGQRALRRAPHTLSCKLVICECGRADLEVEGQSWVDGATVRSFLPRPLPNHCDLAFPVSTLLQKDHRARS